MEDKDIQEQASKALGKIKDKRAVEPLIQALKDENFIGQWEAVWALGEIKDKRAVEPLIEALKDKYVKYEAMEALGKIGDTKYAETIINFIMVDYSLFLLHSEQPPKLRTYIKSMKNLFGDYTDLIIKVFIIKTKETSTVYQYGHQGRIDYDLRESDEAVCELCKINTPISANILHKILQRADIDVRSFWHPDGETHYEILSFESQRKIVKKELEQRGNPPYDPAAYLDKKAWKILR
ncbi:MAG: HEAT repeat domain-containing protein [Candidatus Aminicenantaceae bacterium]